MADIIIKENEVLVGREQLEQLIAQNQEVKADIMALVSVFKELAVVFNGKSKMGIVPVIMKLVNNPEKLQGIAHIVPIIEKYTVTEQNGEAKE